MSYQSPKELITKSVDVLDARVFHRDFSSIRLLNPVGPNDPQITFTRSTSATRVNQNGFIELVNIDTPRFDFDPNTLNCRGLLLEEARTNLIIRSEEFDNGAWVSPNLTLSANSAISPDGTLDADRVSVDSTGIFRYTRQSPTLIQNTTYTLSFYVKSDTAQWIWLLGEGANNIFCWFNIQNGTIGTTTGFTQASIVSASNGWFRCVASFTKTSATASEEIGIGFADANNSTSATLGQSIFLWGAQLEQGAYPTSYIPTTTTSVTRAVDVAQVTGTSFTNFYNRNEGSMVVRCAWNTNTVYDSFIVMLNQDGNNYLALRRNNATNKFFNIRANGQNDILLGFAETEFTTMRTYAAGYRLSNSIFAANTPNTSILNTLGLPVPTSINFGGFSGGANGTITIASFSYYNRRLPDRVIRSFTV